MFLNVAINTLFQGTLLSYPLQQMYKEKFTTKDMALNYAFIGFFAIPSTIVYNKILTTFRTKLFPEFNPHQIKHFSLMYFASKQTLLFDAFFVHFLYHGFIGVSLFSLCSYYYSYRPKEESREKIEPSFYNLLKFRAYLSLGSILCDIWLPQLEFWGKNLKNDPKQILTSKGFQMGYLCKQTIFNFVWQYLIISEYFAYCDK